MNEDNPLFDSIKIVGANYIRDYAYKNGNTIYDFMKQHAIGESTYGQLMDALGSHEAVHRLYGHQIIYDLPIDHPEHIWDFVEHELSDLFTKQGLPILPAELLKHSGLLQYCKSLNVNWNFVNGFDLLTATLAIYQGSKQLRAALNQELSINSFSDLARTIGVGSLELAIAFSTANPFLLIGASLQLTAGFKGMMTSSSVVYFRRLHTGIRIEFQIHSIKVEASLDEHKTQKSLVDMKVQSSLAKAKMKGNQ
jgi:hypothetical protein